MRRTSFHIPAPPQNLQKRCREPQKLQSSSSFGDLYHFILSCAADLAAGVRWGWAKMKIESTTQHAASHNTSHAPTRDRAASSFFEEFLAPRDANPTDTSALQKASKNPSDSQEEDAPDKDHDSKNTNYINSSGAPAAQDPSIHVVDIQQKSEPELAKSGLEKSAAETSDGMIQLDTGAPSSAVGIKSGVAINTNQPVQELDTNVSGREPGEAESKNPHLMQETGVQPGIDITEKHDAEAIANPSTASEAPSAAVSGKRQESKNISIVDGKSQLIQKTAPVSNATAPDTNMDEKIQRLRDVTAAPVTSHELKDSSQSIKSAPVPHDSLPSKQESKDSAHHHQNENGQSATNTTKTAFLGSGDSTETKDLNTLFDISPAGGATVREVPSSILPNSAAPQAAANGPPAEGIFNVQNTAEAAAEQNITVPRELINMSGTPGVDLLRPAHPAAPPQPVTITSQLDEAAARAESILKQIRVHLRNGITELQIRLDPPGLGELTVRFAYDAGRVRARVRATDSTTATLVRDNAGDLKLAMRDAGIDITDLDVGADRGANHRNPSLEEMKESAEHEHHNRRRFFLDSNHSSEPVAAANRAISPRSLDLVV